MARIPTNRRLLRGQDRRPEQPRRSTSGAVIASFITDHKIAIAAVVIGGIILLNQHEDKDEPLLILAPAPPANAQSSSTLNQSVETLRKKEQRAWSAFLGYGVEVPPPPEELMRALKQAWRIGFTTFDVHYIPPLDVSKNAFYPGWKIKPSSVYYIRDYKNFYNSSTKIGGNWYMVDNIKRPSNRVYSLQDEYIGDPLAHMLTDLRETGKIADFERRNSRFNTLWGEVYTIILPKIG